MGKFSTYRYLELKDDTPSPHTNTRAARSIKHPRKLKKVFMVLVVLALCVTYFLGLYASENRLLDGLANSLGYQHDFHHAVIIDAGSSGTRVLAYKFRVPFTVFGKANLDLVEEYFEQSKPGLSSFADKPEEGAQTIVKLIKNAEFLIPAEKARHTPIIVRATAGLRLLPAEKAEQLILSVRQAISKLGYDVSSNAVEIMDGSDEGIFIWYTVNLLHNLLEGETMAALDLGGGSTQITYQLDGESQQVPPQDRHTVPAHNRNITVFTHSYLNLGLLAARAGIFRLEADNANTTKFTSVCVDPIIQDEPWNYANKEHSISGAERPKGQKREVSFDICLNLVKRYVMKTLDFEPKEGPRGAVAAMSFFYDVAADAGIIDVMKGGAVTVAQYRSKAILACSASNVEQPWACIDLVYITSLLQHAYKIRDKDTISLYKKVNGHEVSWALGLAYTTIINRLASS